MNRLISDKQSELEARLQKKIKEGEKEINAGKEEALKQIKAVSEDLALDVIKKSEFQALRLPTLRPQLKIWKTKVQTWQ